MSAYSLLKMAPVASAATTEMAYVAGRDGRYLADHLDPVNAHIVADLAGADSNNTHLDFESVQVPVVEHGVVKLQGDPGKSLTREPLDIPGSQLQVEFLKQDLEHHNYLTKELLVVHGNHQRGQPTVVLGTLPKEDLQAVLGTLLSEGLPGSQNGIPQC